MCVCRVPRVPCSGTYDGNVRRARVDVWCVSAKKHIFPHTHTHRHIDKYVSNRSAPTATPRVIPPLARETLLFPWRPILLLPMSHVPEGKFPRKDIRVRAAACCSMLPNSMLAAPRRVIAERTKMLVRPASPASAARSHTSSSRLQARMQLHSPVSARILERTIQLYIHAAIFIVRSSSAPSGHAARDRQRRLVGPSKGY